MGMLITAAQFADGLPGFVAICDEVPECVGTGDNEAEAIDDLLDQIEHLIIH